ncbi:hypothetical protein QVD17_39162 [Tagetes erecta]|uniref:BHLH domain-containing protein n=1 Tax=Tagetes erecta TaxID=13708 RepID=A0AAD8JN26_TARER|nr:hypothetical protein QVD17_39162 [Tagetes erecta]
MEAFASFSDEEWDILSKMFSSDQDYGHGLFSSQQDDHGFNFETPSVVSSVMTESNMVNASFVDNFTSCYHYEDIDTNFYHNFTQETSNINGCVANDNAAYFPYPSSNISSLPTNGVDFNDEINNNSSLLASVFADESMENLVDPLSVPIVDKIKHTPAKRKIEMSESENAMEDKDNDQKPDENLKKKTRVSRDKKTKKKVQPKKKQKVMDDTCTMNAKGVEGEDADNNKVEGNAPIASSSSCSSEDDLNGGAINSNWKTRAGRGAATDPQSLYARKRRERINERLKVLQNLVPNGTKVDISTMLEEAVQYVKFLQLQIKLLSSDEMWMYAPIAYNGMDMGLYQKLSHS